MTSARAVEIPPLRSRHGSDRGEGHGGSGLSGVAGRADTGLVHDRVGVHGHDQPGDVGDRGIGWRSGNLLYGAFAGYGRQDVDFGYRRGDFRQTDTSIGGYLGWQGQGGLWANAQASWTQLGFDVTRQVNLGPAIRQHRGSPDGDNLSVGASAGWTFGHGALAHGPVLSVLAQKQIIEELRQLPGVRDRAGA